MTNGAPAGRGYFDADGHVLEAEAEIAEFIEEPFFSGSRRGNLLPDFDRFHGPISAVLKSHPGTFLPAPAGRWLEFLDMTGTEGTVLYPTRGLFSGRTLFPQVAVAYARAYNSWLHEKFVKVSPRLQAVGLLPMQDIPAAEQEAAPVRERARHGGWDDPLERPRSAHCGQGVLARLPGRRRARLRDRRPRRELRQPGALTPWAACPPRAPSACLSRS